MENKICQNCKIKFEITNEDLKFYERMQVPSPTFCPECRSKNRMNWRNERNLYKRICDGTEKNIITMFPSNQKLTIYDRDFWWKNSFDPLEYGQKIDFNKSIFLQFKELFEKVPPPSLLNENIVNSSFCNCVHNVKNGYLLFASMETENVIHSTRVIGGKDSIDIFGGFNQEMCYENIMCDKSHHLFFSERSAECFDSFFLSDCRNLNNCIGCVNLRNMSYCILNKSYNKETYKEALKNLKLDTYNGLLKFKNEFENLKKKMPKKYANIIRCHSVTGDNVTNSKNSKHCFDAYRNLENCGYCVHSLDLRDSYDGYGVGDNSEQLYGVIDSGVNASQLLSTICVHESRNIYYSYNCHNSSNLFFCTGLRNKQYCILNKQYTKEKYEKLIPKIIENMNKIPYIDQKKNEYRFGDFFPAELSPFCYNETIAQEYFPLTKEEAIEQGYKWKDREERNYTIDIYNKDIPDNIKDIDDSMINKIIECKNHSENKNYETNCTEGFKIIENEFNFYKKMNLPLPRYCPNCRHYNRLKQRNPLKLWHRKCMKEGCQNEFETSYSPDRPEIIYCEKCYQQEVY